MIRLNDEWVPVAFALLLVIWVVIAAIRTFLTWCVSAAYTVSLPLSFVV